ncbi:restriction endonuclease subunit S [Streptomyces sp. NPDC005794]|uniref:restriction endonuclease subunit S n=1 Tax=Streptomyces sp. NPDC005794 TaxID=3364733 RepID=UPI003699E929
MSEKELPAGWAVATLGQVADWGSGGTPKAGTPEYYGGGIPWAVIGDLTDGPISETAATITDAGLANSSAKWVPEGAVLIAMYGSIGKLGITKHRVTTNQAIAFAVAEDRLMDPLYLFWYLRSQRAELLRAGKGGTQQNISQTVLKAWPVPVPPLAEQHRIVEALEGHLARLDAADLGLRKSLVRASSMRQSFVGRSLRGEGVPLLLAEGTAEDLCRRPQSARDAGPWVLPSGWLWASVGELFDVFVGSTPSRKNPEFWSGSVPWVSSGEVKFNRISSTRESITESAVGNQKSRIHPPGTVMMAMIGEGRTRGQVAILDIEAAHNQNCVSIRVSDTRILPEYVYLALEQQYQESRRVSSGGNQPALNKGKVKAMQIPLPPLATQREIVAVERDFSEAASRLRAALHRSLARSAHLRRALLHRAFTGTLVPQDPTDEPAFALLARIQADRAAQPNAKRIRPAPVSGKVKAPMASAGPVSAPAPTPAPAHSVQQEFDL